MDDLLPPFGTGRCNKQASEGDEFHYVGHSSEDVPLVSSGSKREIVSGYLGVTNLEQRVSRLESLLTTMARQYTIEVTEEHGEWFARDIDLDVTGNGETRAEAIAQLAEAVAHETGELELSAEFRADMEAATEQIEAGNTHSAEDVRDRLGIDD